MFPTCCFLWLVCFSFGSDVRKYGALLKKGCTLVYKCVSLLCKEIALITGIFTPLNCPLLCIMFAFVLFAPGTRPNKI